MWSRRHVPLVFHHATFPLSLEAASTAVLNQKAMAAAAPSSATSTKKSKFDKKRKSETPIVKIDPGFTVTPVEPTSDAAGDESRKKSLATFVQRITKTPAARNNYSGLAGTLKHLRSQSDKQKDTTDSKGRPNSSSTSASTSATPSAPSSTSLSSSSSAATLASARVGAHFADPTAFHPQVTKELLVQHKKQMAKVTTPQPFKKQKTTRQQQETF